MESAEAEAVAGEGKAVTSERSHGKAIACGVPECSEARDGENVFVERFGLLPGALQCGALLRLHARESKAASGTRNTLCSEIETQGCTQTKARPDGGRVHLNQSLNGVGIGSVRRTAAGGSRFSPDGNAAPSGLTRSAGWGRTEGGYVG